MNLNEISTSPATGRISRITQSIAITPSSTALSRMFRVDQPLASTQLREALKSPQRQNRLETSTKPHEASDSLYSRIESIFWAAKGEFFEDGMESTFSRQLNSVVKKYGNDAMEVITCLIVYERVNPEVADEALRWLGRMEDSESYEYRRWLLERSLNLSSHRVRDGAILGLASMDDKHAIPYLKHAMAKEQCAELKVDMEQVLEQLEI
jgi:hypothetical protein